MLMKLEFHHKIDWNLNGKKKSNKSTINSISQYTDNTYSKLNGIFEGFVDYKNYFKNNSNIDLKST